MSLSQRQVDALEATSPTSAARPPGWPGAWARRRKLEEDWEAQYALARCVEIVGEAGKRLGPQFHQHHASLPWKLITGMRDKLIHHYDQVNPAILWQTVTDDLPAVLGVVEEALRAES